MTDQLSADERLSLITKALDGYDPPKVPKELLLGEHDRTITLAQVQEVMDLMTAFKFDKINLVERVYNDTLISKYGWETVLEAFGQLMD